MSFPNRLLDNSFTFVALVYFPVIVLKSTISDASPGSASLTSLASYEWLSSVDLKLSCLIPLAWWF